MALHAARLPAGVKRFTVALSSGQLVLGALVLVVIFIAFVPFGFMVWNSFKPLSGYTIANFSLTEWSLQNYVHAYQDPASLRLLGNSFAFALGSMTVGLVIGGSLAFLVERTNVPFRNAIYAFMFIPLAVPSLLKALGWVLLLSPRIGILNQLWFVLGFDWPLFTAETVVAMFWVEGFSMAPLTFLMLGAALRAMDPALEEAAYVSGSSRIQTMLRVTLRLMWPALAGIGLLQFVRGIEAFEVPLVMGVPHGIVVFATNVYLSIKAHPPRYGDAFAFSMTVVAVAMVGVFLYLRSLSHFERYATITGKGYRPRLLDLGKWRPLGGAFALLFIVAAVLPLLAILWASLLRYYRAPSLEALSLLTLENYRFLLATEDLGKALQNSAILSSTVALGCTVLALVVSWMVVRLRTPGAKVLDFLVFSTYAVPSVAMAFSFAMLFLSFPNPVYGTVWLLVLPYIANFLPIATRFTHSGMAQLSKELEEAASASGATLLAAIRRITVPLILPTLVAGCLYVFILTTKVATIALILHGPHNMILPVLVFRVWNEGSIGGAAALSVMLIVGLLVLVILGRRFIQRGGAIDRI